MEHKRHWKKFMNPNYLGAYAFDPEEIKTVTIKTVGAELVQNQTGNKEECIVAHFVEDVKPMVLNKTNCKIIESLYDTPYIEDWPGKKIQLKTKRVAAFGGMTDAVRVMPSLPGTDLICEECHRIIKPAAGKSAQELANIAKEHTGKQLCLECQRAYAEKQEEKNNG